MRLEIVALTCSLLIMGGIVLYRMIRPARVVRGRRSGGRFTFKTYEEGYAQAERAIADAHWRLAKDVIAHVQVQFPESVQPNLLVLLSQAQYELKEYDDARATYSQVIALVPDDPQHHTNIAYICMKLRTPAQAVEHLRRAIDLDRDNAALYNDLVNAYRANNQHTEARAVRLQSMELKGKYEARS